MRTENFLPGIETDDHIKDHSALASRVEKYWGVELVKMETVSSLDYGIIKGETLTGWLELKCRTHSFGTFSEYMIELKKWNALRRYTATTNLKAFIGVGFTDGDFWVDVARITEFRVAPGGRTDRDWKRDTGSMVYFDIKYFKKWKTA